MKEILAGKEFDYISDKAKQFIVAFDEEMNALGYDCGGAVGPGYCWGRHMAIYTKTGVKSKKSYARVYIRDEDIVLRLYFSKVDAHAQAVEQSPDFIKEVFTGPFGDCSYCHNQNEAGACSHRKSYTLDGQLHEKCDGNTFWFFNPEVSRLPAYKNIFLEFYPAKKRAGGQA